MTNKQRTIFYAFGAVVMASAVSVAVVAMTPRFAAARPAQPGRAMACPASHFLAVTAHAKNAAYPAPMLSVTCGATTFVIESNGIPSFEFVQTTPNALQAQSYRWELSLSPASGVTRSVPLGGASAVAVDGLPIFGPTEAPRDGYRDPYLDNILDFCNGHTAPRGDYHFHARPECLIERVGTKPGAVLGYGTDGVPILTPYVCVDIACTTTKKVTSGWQVVNNAASNAWEKHGYTGAGDLDVCNGGVISDGSYAYFATDSFPYFMGCYRGTVPADAPRFRTQAEGTAVATVAATSASGTQLGRKTYLPFTAR